MITEILFYLALTLGIVIFIKLGNRIPLINRIIMAISAVIILILLFLFISTIFTLIVVILVILLLIGFLSGNVLKINKIRLKR